MNMFDMGMYGMMHPDERRKILERGSLYTAGGDQAVQNKEPWHKGFFWSKGKKDQDQGQGISLSDAGPLGPMQMQFDKRGNVLNQGSAILPSGQVVGIPDKQKQRYEPPIQKTGTLKPFHPSQGGQGDKGFHNNETEQLKWWQTLANKAGIDFSKAAASWKEKGGFEGLMSNPAFTMGLAFMQAGAEGKTLGSGALNNVMKAAGISSHYKQILKDREQAPIEVTATDVAEVKSLLQSMDISGPSKVEKFFGFLGGKKNMEFKWDLASEEIAVELQKEIKKLKENKKPGAPEVVYDTTKKLQILKRMFDKGRFKKKGGTWFTDSTLQTTQEIPTLDSNKPKINKKNPLKGYVGFAQGGQIQEGQHAIVGEGGPEYFLPKESGKILSNDDSRIFAMLLAANPQLQQVSRTRSEKILRNRFPEYFE